MAEKFDTFLVKRNGKWLHVKEKWVDGQEVARPALQAKGFETGTAMRDGKDRWVNVPDSQVEKAMEMGLHIPSAEAPTQKTEADFRAEREAEEAAQPQPLAQTVTDNIVDSLQFNQLPNTEGALRTAGDFITGDVNVSDNFAKHRQAVIDRMAKGRKDHPIIANGVATAVDVANPVNPFGKFKGATKAIGALAKYGKALPTLVSQGGEAALRSLGHAGSGEEVLTDTVLGGGLGALGEGLTSHAVKDWLQERKINAALKHFGNQKSISNKLGADNLNEAAEYAVEKGLIRPGEEAGETLDLIAGKRGKASERLGAVRDELTSQDIQIDPAKVFGELTEDKAFDPDILNLPAFSGDAKFSENMLASMLPEKVNDGMGFGDLLQAREVASRLSKWDKGRALGTNSKDNMARKAYGQMNDIIEREGNAVGGDLGSRFRETNREFRLLKDLETLADHKVKRDQGNHALGLRATILGAGLGAGGGLLNDLDPTGGILSTGLGALGAQGVMKYGPGLTANAIKKVQKNYGNWPGKTARTVFDAMGNRAQQGQDEADQDAAINKHLGQ